MDSQTETVIYNGPRGEKFTQFIKSLLEKSKIKEKYLKALLTSESIQEYSKAFTSITANETENYEIFEQLGDVSANKFIVWYAYKRFPQLMCTLGVKVVARLRINYGARQSFSKIGDSLGFWEFISATEEERGHKKKDLLEDCVESFCGCTEYLFRQYLYAWSRLCNCCSDFRINFRHHFLYPLDMKIFMTLNTRLKELFDMYKDLGTWAYISVRDDKLVKAKIYLVPKGMSKRAHERKATNERGQQIVIKSPVRGWTEIGEGVAAKKSDAEQKAAEMGLRHLNRKGYKKPISAEYRRFMNP